MQHLIDQMEEEVKKLGNAIAILKSESPNSNRGGGRRKGRRMSAAAKKQISRAMKKRWAQRKRTLKAAA